MRHLRVPTRPFSPELLEKSGIHLNEYARIYLQHPILRLKELPDHFNFVLLTPAELGYAEDTHWAPDGSITVLSEPLSHDDAFPKGLYLRNVSGRLWLRGYVCDADFLWSASDVFALSQ